MPVLLPRPRRLINVVGVGALGLAVGIGATLAVHGRRGGGPVATAAVIVAVGLALAAQGAAQL